MKEKTMTIQEIADAMGVSKNTIRNCVRRVFPDKMKQGKTTYFNEAEVAVISKELKNNTMVEARITSENFYQVKNTTTEFEVIANALNAFKALQDLYTHKEAEYKATIEAQKEKIALDAPKVAEYDELAGRDYCRNFRDTAETLGVAQKELKEWLLSHKYIYEKPEIKEYRAYYKYQQYFKLVAFVKNGHKGNQLLVTLRGIEHLRSQIKAA